MVAKVIAFPEQRRRAGYALADSFYAEPDGRRVLLLATNLCDLETGIPVPVDGYMTPCEARLLAKELLDAADAADKESAHGG